MQVEIASSSSLRLLPSLLLLLAACGAEEKQTEADASADTGLADGSSDGTGSGSGTACITFAGSHEPAACTQPDTTPTSEPGPARDPSCGASAKWVTSISGTVLDDSGAPVPCAKAQVCVRAGKPVRLTCLRPVTTAQDGTFTIPVGTEVQCMASATLRLFAPGQPLATTYCGVDLASEGDISLAETGRLFRLKQPENAPAFCDQSVAQSVSLDGGLSVEVVPALLSDPAGDLPELLAAKVDPAATGLCFLGSEAPALLYAFGPEVDIAGDGFAFSLPNNLGLAAGATANLFILGGLSTTVGTESIKEGEWHLYGQGTVSPDGSRILAEGDNGLPYLSWLGVTP
jgi:hypothetical protein